MVSSPHGAPRTGRVLGGSRGRHERGLGARSGPHGAGGRPVDLKRSGRTRRVGLEDRDGPVDLVGLEIPRGYLRNRPVDPD